MDVARRKAAVASLSVASNATLVVLKLVVGLAIGSVSVLSEAIHSGVDLVAAVIALVAVKASARPADAKHQFGHGKVENVSGTIEALLIFLAAAWIIYEAVKKLVHPEPLDAAGWGVAVMLVSAIANLLVSQRLFKVGRETDSIALQADAWHLRTDVYTSAGVMAALGLILLGRVLLPGRNLSIIDPIAAIVVALLILKAAWELTRDSARDLLDASLPPAEEQWIRDCVARYEPDVTELHLLRTRKAGADRFIEFHIKVAPEMTVAESHALVKTLEREIQARFPGTRLSVHLDPKDPGPDA
ncbi:MAG: cation transporter [Deltaproteobacteria bacterium]|nr:cation transporter [Deltaproteobacteria bacterium]